MNVSFNIPTKILMERNCVYKNAQIFKDYGSKALIVTGKKSASSNGSLNDVVDALNEVGIPSILFNKVMANPTIELVYEGAEVAKRNNVDLVIAIGGGSAMDAAKAIALLARQDIKEDMLFTAEYTSDVLPMIFIPTTAGTGSEVTPYAILTNDVLETKSTISSKYLFPKVALLDGIYMKNLGVKTTINTALDALCHAIEGYLSVKANPMTRALSREAISVIASELENLIEFDLTLDSRDKLLYASTIAGMVIAHTGTVAVHILGYSLTYFNEIDHGRANGLLLASFLRLVNHTYPNLIDDILISLGMESLEEFEEVLNKLLGDKEILSDEEITRYADKAYSVPKLKNTIIDLDIRMLKQILVESMKG